MSESHYHREATTRGGSKFDTQHKICTWMKLNIFHAEICGQDKGSQKRVPPVSGLTRSSAHFRDKWHWLMYLRSGVTCDMSPGHTCGAKLKPKHFLLDLGAKFQFVTRKTFAFDCCWLCCNFWRKKKINDVINNSNTIISLCFIHKQILPPRTFPWTLDRAGGDIYCCDH